AQSNYACHDDQTEALTSRGWVPHDQLDERTFLAAVNPRTFEIEYQRPTAIHVYRHDGPMVRFLSPHGLDVMVTPNHRMLITQQQRFRDSGGSLRRDELRPWRFLEAGETAERSSGFFLPPSATGCRGETMAEFTLHAEGGRREFPGDAWLRFLGFWLARGWAAGDGERGRFQVGIAHPEGNVADEIRETFAELAELTVHEDQNAAGDVAWTIADRGLHAWLSEHCGTDAKSRKAPDFLRRLSGETIAVMLDAMVQAGEPDCGPRLADDLLELGVKAGFLAETRAETEGGWSKVKLRRGELNLGVHPTEHVGTADYQGDVWCATVPHGLMVTRRNGKPAITGNSTLVAEGPAVKMFQRLQATLIADDLDVMSRVLARGIEIGELPPDAGRRVRVQTEAPSLVVRDKFADARANDVKFRHGVLSQRTWQLQEGLDPDQERRNREEEAAADEA
ncbi:MAG: hypothetical protein N2C14_32280, partial [Planctomycetales bacterium]